MVVSCTCRDHGSTAAAGAGQCGRACGTGAGAILFRYGSDLERTVWKIAIEIGRRPQKHLGRKAISRTILIRRRQVGEGDGTSTVRYADRRVRTVDNYKPVRHVGYGDGDNGFRAVDVIR